MADTAVHNMTEITAPASTDLVYLDVDPAGTPVDRKCTIANLITAGIESILTTRGDLLTRDASGAVRLAVGAAGAALGADGTDIGWVGVQGVSLGKITTETITSGSWQDINFSGSDTENWDNGAWHDGSTNNERIVCPTGEGGTYNFLGRLFWDQNSTNRRAGRFQGTVTPARACQDTFDAVSAFNPSNNVPKTSTIAAAEYEVLQAFQDSGSNRSVSTADTFLQASRLVIDQT